MLRALAAALFLLSAGAAWAGPFPTINQDVGVCDPNNPTHCAAPDASGNLPVTGTITASLGGFTPSASGARMTTLTVTVADSSGTLPTGAVVVVSNVGSNPMYCNVNGVAATTSDEPIPTNSWFAFTIPNGVTTLHCIATGGSTTANGVGGAGLATGAGGGSGGGGGGGTVTQGNAGSNAQAWWAQIGDTTNGPAAVVTAGADAVSNTQSGLAGYARNEVYNGTTWDRLRSGTATGSVVVNNATAANLNATVVQATAANLNATVAPSSLTAWGIVAQGSTTSGQSGQLILGAVTTGAPTYTTAQSSPLSLDTAGNLRVNVVAGGGSGGTSSSFSATFPATGTAAGAEYLSSPPTLTTGQMVALQVTSAGSLHTTVDNTLTAITNGDGVTTGTWGTGSPVAGLNYAFNGTSYDRLEDDSNKNLKAVIPPPVGGANFANTQVSVASTATQIVAARTGVSGTGRISATVCNTSTVAVYLGGSGVTTSTGQYLAGVAGACATFQTTAAIYGIVATGTETVGATEVY